MATCLATVPAGSARAAEPFDTEVANLLVAPGDPAFVEIADPADPAHSGPLDAVRLGTLAAGRSAARTPIRGGAVRGFADGSGHRLVEIGYDLTNGTNARQAVEAHRSLGTTFAVQGIPGAVGVVMPRQPGSAALAFSMGSRTFLLVLGGDDPGHALLQDQALQVANAAAEDLAGSLTAASAGGAPASTASGAATKPAATASDAGGADGATAADGLVARARRVLHGRDVQLALAAVAAVALWLLVRSSQRRHRPAVAAPPAMRGSSQAWQQVGAWGGNPAHWSGGAAADSFVTSGPPAAMALGGPVAAEVDGADAYYWGERQVLGRRARRGGPAAGPPRPRRLGPHLDPRPRRADALDPCRGAVARSGAGARRELSGARRVGRAACAVAAALVRGVRSVAGAAVRAPRPGVAGFSGGLARRPAPRARAVVVRPAGARGPAPHGGACSAPRRARRRVATRGRPGRAAHRAGVDVSGRWRDLQLPRRAVVAGGRAARRSVGRRIWTRS